MTTYKPFRATMNYTSYPIRPGNFGHMIEAFAVAGWGPPLPNAVRLAAERILDGAARRLLAEQVDGDAIGAASGRHVDASHGDAD